MARGWESKAVEEQISEREAESKKPANPELTPAQCENQAKREGLRLARTHTLAALQSTRNERYRAILEGALAHLDSQIAESEQ
jgi:hypothetical protein